MDAVIPKTTVVISNLKRDIDEEALAVLCGQLGRVVSFRLQVMGSAPESLAAAIVEYVTEEEAVTVVNAVKGRLISGRPVTASAVPPGTQYVQAATAAASQTASPATTAPPAHTHPAYPSEHESRTVPPAHENGSSPVYDRYRAGDKSEQEPRAPPRAIPSHAWKTSRDPHPPEVPLPPVRYSSSFSQPEAWPPVPARAIDRVADAPSRYVDERDEAPYAAGRTGQQPWPSRSGDRNQDARWPPSQDRASHYASSRDIHPEHSAYSRSSAWPDDVDARAPHRYSDDSHHPHHRTMSHPSRGPPVAAERADRGDEGYMDEVDMADAPRRRAHYSGHVGHGAPPRRDPSWTERGGYEAPSMPSKEEFDKEVMRQAALLVAERELRAREETRQNKGDEQQHTGKEIERKYTERLPEDNKRKDRIMLPSNVANHRRTRSADSDRMNKRQALSREGRLHKRESRDNGENRGKWSDGAKRDDRREEKRPPREPSPPGSGGGRADERAGVGGKYRLENSPRDGGAHRDEEWRGGKQRRDDRKHERERENTHDKPRSRDDRRDDGRERQLESERGRPREDGQDRKRGDDRGRHREDARVDTRSGGDDRINFREGDRGKYREDERLRRDAHAGARDNHARDREPRSYKPFERSSTGKPGDMDSDCVSRAHRPGDHSTDRFGERVPKESLTPGAKQWESSTADQGWYVHVGGVKFSTTFTDLAKSFAAFGDVNGFKVIFNNVTCRTQRSPDTKDGGQKRKHDDGDKKNTSDAPVEVLASTGFAFISFDNKESMEKAIEGMNNQKLDGSVLKVSRGRITNKFSATPGRPYMEPGSSTKLRPLNTPRPAPSAKGKYEPLDRETMFRDRKERLPHTGPKPSAAVASVVAAAASASAAARESSSGMSYTKGYGSSIGAGSSGSNSRRSSVGASNGHSMRGGILRAGRSSDYKGSKADSKSSSKRNG